MESLERQEIGTELGVLHKRMVWKFGLIMYCLIHRHYPFSFLEANKHHQAIDPTTAKRYVDHIKFKIEGNFIEWNPNYSRINDVIKRALVYRIHNRIWFHEIQALFAELYAFYQPVEKMSSLVSNHMMNLTKNATPSQALPETRQVLPIDQEIQYCSL